MAIFFKKTIFGYQFDTCSVHCASINPNKHFLPWQLFIFGDEMEAQEELKGAPPESTPAAEESGDEGNDPLDPIPNTYSKIMEAKIASL